MGNPTRLLEAARLKGYWDNYVKYLDNVDERQDNVGNGTKREAQQELYVFPFGVEFNFTNQRVTANGHQATWTARKSSFLSYTDETWTGGEKQVIRLPRYRPAKILFVTWDNELTGKRTESKRTKRPYLKYNTKSRGVPFGRASENTTQEAAFTALKTAFKDAPNVKIARQKEKV